MITKEEERLLEEESLYEMPHVRRHSNRECGRMFLAVYLVALHVALAYTWLARSHFCSTSSRTSTADLEDDSCMTISP